MSLNTGRKVGAAPSPVAAPAAASSVRRTMLQRLFACLMATILACGAASAADLHFEQSTLTATPVAGVSEVALVFPFTNRSARPVVIAELKTSCHCLTATVDQRTVGPGDSGEVTARYAITGFGRQRTTIIVSNDDPDQPQILLTVEMVLPEGPVVEPRVLHWERGAALDTRLISVRIPAELPLLLSEAVDRRRWFVAEVRQTADPKVISIAVTPRQTEHLGSGDIAITFSGGQVIHVMALIRQPSGLPRQP